MRKRWLGGKAGCYCSDCATQRNFIRTDVSARAKHNKWECSACESGGITWTAFCGEAASGLAPVAYIMQAI